ncbi:hypothetical protein [Maricaulis maris]|uniref:Uncharacterized protein n=1 Tax=Maricaulis maris TaxID=74318 RepID=A0A495DDJ1_9PROT|nr:hypothetical protein [Maricaulis maris]RKR00378.1 hypothetical protein C7435_1584 [Maricaulis maris]
MLPMIALATALSSATFAPADTPAAVLNALKPVGSKLLQDESARSLTIEADLRPFAALSLDDFDLRNGEWEQPPMRFAFQMGEPLSYTASTTDTNAAMFGNLNFSVSEGAALRIDFVWDPSGAPSCTVSGRNLDPLPVEAELIDSTRFSTTCRVAVEGR